MKKVSAVSRLRYLCVEARHTYCLIIIKNLISISVTIGFLSMIARQEERAKWRICCTIFGVVILYKLDLTCCTVIDNGKEAGGSIQHAKLPKKSNVSRWLLHALQSKEAHLSMLKTNIFICVEVQITMKVLEYVSSTILSLIYGHPKPQEAAK